MMRRDAVIIGAGPAGMSAAIAMAEAGLKPTVIDENAQTGGQIYRQRPSTLNHRAAPSHNGVVADRGADLRRRFEALSDRIELLCNRQVWGIFESNRLAVTAAHRWQMIEAEHLLLAPGAYEYVPPFPGWTLPGVLTPGAAQIMIKTQAVLPGQRVLVAGTGPFLLVVAAALHEAGVNVLGVVEAVSRAELLRCGWRLFADLGLLREGGGYLRKLRRAGIPIYDGRIIVGAGGDGEVSHVKFAACDRSWRPKKNRSQVIEVDTLCVGYGFVPRTELAQLAGCQLRWSNELGGWIPLIDAEQQTTVRGVWAAGDGAGVAGALVAQEEGTLAGLAMARQLGAIDDDCFEARRRPVVRRLARLRRFRAALDSLSRIRVGLDELCTDETIVCRCEELTRAEIDKGIDAGNNDLRSLKVATRLGMGPCQGRMCAPAMARHLAWRTDQAMDQSTPLQVRPPIVPLTLGDLADPVSMDLPVQEQMLRETIA